MRQDTNEISAEDYRDLSRAILLYLQWGHASWPQSDKAAVIAVFGEEQGKVLLQWLASLFDEMQAIPVDWNKHTLASAGDFVRAVMQERYPGLSDETLDAMSWAYTFWNK